ncbi:MAG: hypothetical protein KDD52_02865 [Bdellovibrionales bacterium]|nr:hypothetical protein [Bdellovibrionales bacterium]
MNLLLCVIAAFFSLFPLPSYASSSTQQSFQLGFEYDSNTFKSLSNTQSDFLTRALFQAEGKIHTPSKAQFSWQYQGGAKKYFLHSEQDLFIQYISGDLKIPMSSLGVFYIHSQMKYQNEKDKKDSSLLDVNEDYYLLGTEVGTQFILPLDTILGLEQGLTYFDFNDANDFSYVHANSQLQLYRNIGSKLRFGSSYRFSRQDFGLSNRIDRAHVFSFFGQWRGIPYFSLQYSYTDSQSSIKNFSFQSHRFSLLHSWVFGGKSMENPKYGLHMIGNLQLKKYPTIVFVDDEGQRLLLTDSEDENFNSFVCKFSIHPKKNLSIETKTSIVLDNFSSQNQSFRRITNYVGLRVDI